MTSDAQIKAFIDRILRLKEEQDTIGEDIRDIYAEAKSIGFDKTAMGNVVAHLRKVAKKGHDTVAEQGAIFDLYLCAYESKSPHAPAPARTRENIEQFDREARAKRRTSEAMDDNIAFSAKMLADGLISEEAHAENIALSNAVAMKLGAGVIDPETGDILDDQPRSDGGLHIVTKHTEIPTSAGGESEEVAKNAVASASGPDEKRATNSPEGANELLGGFPVAAAETNAEETGVLASTRQGMSVERGIDQCVTGGESAATEIQANPEEAGPHGETESVPAVDAGSRPVFGRSETATSENGRDSLERQAPIPGVIYEAVPPAPMKSLPYAASFPELTKAEYGRLEFSIIGIGVSKPIVRKGDVIIDGWNRYNIARSLGIRYPVEEYTGPDILLDVIAWQREARQFTPTQERQIAARLVKEIPHRAADIMAAFDIAEEVA